MNQKYTGRSGRLYVSRDRSSAAVPAVRLTHWELNIDLNPHLPELTGHFRGHWDDPDGVLDAAMMSMNGTKIILYPSDKDEPYASGPAWLDIAEINGTRSGLFMANGEWQVTPSLATFAAVVAG